MTLARCRLRLFSIVDRKQILTPFFVFCFLILSENPFLKGSKNKKWVKNYLILVSHTKKRVIFCISRESKQKTNFCSMGRIGEGRCSSGRVEWESDRFQRKFLSDILVCLFWNIFYCRSEIFWKYKADMPLYQTVQVWGRIFLGISRRILNRSTWCFFSYFPP